MGRRRNLLGTPRIALQTPYCNIYLKAIYYTFNRGLKHYRKYIIECAFLEMIVKCVKQIMVLRRDFHLL